MQNSTKKFLSFLLVLAMLLSFPIAASANQAYDETFTGTYTRPLQAKDTLFSGEDSRLTEWYGERVNVGQNTYSVRQNQYGLNVDGNMIDAEEKTKYTVWLAQYGVASFRFEAPEDGDYIVLTSRNEEYTDKDDMNGWENWINIFNYRKNLRSEEYKGYTLDSLQYRAKYAYCVYENQYYEGGFFYVSVGAQTDYDCVFDVEILNVKDLTKENCPHYTYDTIYTEKNGCTTNYTKKCKICGEEFKTEETDHYWYDVERVEPEDDETDICDNEIFYKGKCLFCGLLSSWTDSKHDFNSDSVEIIEKNIYYSDISYYCVCKLCGEEFYEYEDSPCYYNYETNEYEHNFGDKDLNEVNCKNTVECKKCGYVCGEDKHDYGDVNWEDVNCKNPATCKLCGHKAGVDDHHWVDMIDYLNPSHSCFVEKGQMCKICGEKETYSEPYVRHSCRTYVQVTPQYQNHCGTYRMYCEDCGNYITEAAPVHTGTWEYDEKSGTYFMNCTRCKERVSYQDIHPNEVIPGGGSTGGGSIGGGGGGGFAPAPTPEEPTTEPTTKPENNTNNTTTTTTTKKPATVTIKKPQAKKKSVVVTWKAEKNVSGYEVQIATDKKFKKNKKSVKIDKKKASKKTFKNLKSNKKYYVRVRSYKIVNGKKVYGKWSKVKSVKTK